MRPFPAILLGLGASAAAVAGSEAADGGYSADPHRYWRINVTAAMNAAGLAAFSNVVMATQRGGAHALGAVTPTASSTNFGSAANAQDSDVNTIWVGQTMPITLTWDLGATSSNWKDIRELRVNVDPAWHPQGPKTFSVQYSDNGTTWTDRITVSSDTGWDGNTTFGWRGRIYRASVQPAGAAGYQWYRLVITAGVDVTQCAIGDIEFRATLGGSDLMNPSGPIFWSQAGQAWRNAVDDSSGTAGWFGTAGFPYTVGVELSNRSNLAQLSITPYSGFQAYAPKDFTIEGSNDFVIWNNLSTVSAQTGWAASPTARLFNI